VYIILSLYFFLKPMVVQRRQRGRSHGRRLLYKNTLSYKLLCISTPELQLDEFFLGALVTIYCYSRVRRFPTFEVP
jgi:hypothetical protein